MNSSGARASYAVTSAVTYAYIKGLILSQWVSLAIFLMCTSQVLPGLLAAALRLRHSSFMRPIQHSSLHRFPR